MSSASTRSPVSAPTATGLSLLLAFLAVSLNSRVAFGQVGPLAPVWSLDRTTVTVLGVVPPALMGICAPLTPVVRRRVGDDGTLMIASAVLLVGCAIRPLGVPGLLIGTAIAAAAIALINVVIPVVVRTRFPAAQTGIMMGLYAVCMGVGSAAVAALMVPVARATGSWQPAIAMAIVPAAIACVAVAPLWKGRCAGPAVHPQTTPAISTQHPGRTALGWSLLCFFGIQTLVFYAVLAWLSTILVAGGTDATTAGIAQSCFIVGIGVGGFAAPALAGRRSDHRLHIGATIAVCVLGVVAVAVTHGTAAVVASLVLGAGLGGGQSLPGVLYAHRGKTPERIASLSTFAQTGGYLLAATGPLLLPALHAATGSWRVPLVVVIVLLVVNGALSMRAGHDAAGHSPTTLSPVATPNPNALETGEP